MVTERIAKIILAFALYILLWAFLFHEITISLSILAGILFGLFYWMNVQLLPKERRYTYFWTIGILYAGLLLATTVLFFWFLKLLKYVLRDYVFLFAIQHHINFIVLAAMIFIFTVFCVTAFVLILRVDYKQLMIKLQGSLNRKLK